MNQINVLYLIRTWAIGGSHTIIRSLLKHLPSDRFNITCVPYAAPGHGNDAFVNLLRKEGIAVTEDRIPWHGRSNWFKARDAIAALISKHRIDLLHAHDPHSVVLAGLGRKRWPCACVASEYGYWRRLFPLRSHVYTFIENTLVLPAYDRVITVSNDMRRKILAGGTRDERLRVVRTGLDWTLLRSRSTREAIRTYFGIPEKALVVGTVGRLYEEKGHVYLLKATAQLAQVFPDLRVLIVGTGTLLARLQTLAERLGIRDRTIFTGFYDDLAGALSVMDVFALPSVLDEGLPTVLLEAQAMGLPVVATNLGGTPEAMAPGQTGLLVPARDVSALSAAMTQLLGDRTKRERMGEAAGKWLRASCPLEGMVDRVAGVYEEALTVYREAS